MRALIGTALLAVSLTVWAQSPYPGTRPANPVQLPDPGQAFEPGHRRQWHGHRGPRQCDPGREKPGGENSRQYGGHGLQS